MPDVDTRDHLYELIKSFRTAMLTTRTREGAGHCRPMAVAELKLDADASFATGLDSTKVAEIEAFPQIMVTFQNASEYAVIYGVAKIIKDRAEIDRLWSEAWRVWFPNGRDDPNLCILKLEAVDAEYWDNSGLEGFKYVFEGVKAVLQGRKPISDASQHAKIKL